MSNGTRRTRTGKWIAALAVALTVLVVALIALLRTPSRADEPVVTEQLAAEPEPADARSPIVVPHASIVAPSAGPDTRTVSPSTPLGAIDGFVVDEATGEAVPECDVTFTCGDASETVHTDLRGAFATATGLPAGEVDVLVTDVGERVGHDTLHHTFAGTHGCRIRVPIGPTYPFLSMDDADPLPEHWQARIVATCVPDGRAGILAVRAGSVSVVAPSGDKPDHVAAWHTLRKGTQPWVRYPRVPFSVDPGYRGHLELCNDTWHRSGEVPILSIHGVHTPLAMVCERHCVVTGHVGGLPSGVSARVMVFPAECVPKIPKLTSATAWEEGLDDGRGFTIDDVPPGPKVIVAIARGHHVVSAPFDTDAGPPPPLFLEPGTRELPRTDDSAHPDEEIAMGIHIYLGGEVSVFGKFGPISDFQLARHVLSNVGPLAGSFLSLVYEKIEGENDSLLLPIGDCNVTMIGVTGPSACDDLIARPALGRLEIPERPRGHAPVHVARARDATSGDAIAGAHVLFTPPGTMLVIDAETDTPWRMSTRSRVTFSVWARGHQPGFGDTSSFVAADKALSAVIDLQPGLGAQLFFRARPPHDGQEPRALPIPAPHWFGALMAAPPVPGVEVEGPGTHAACSDENGELHVTASAECELTLRAKGWQIDYVELINPEANAWIVWMKSTAR